MKTDERRRAPWGVAAQVIGFALCLALAIGGAACRGNGNTNSKDFDEAQLKDPPNLKKGVKPEPDAEVAGIEMENPGYGRIGVEL